MSRHYLIIIGAMKSATTSLYHLLGQHPEICTSDVKEPEYFLGDYQWQKGAYDSCWSTWNDSMHTYALEASTSYTKVPSFPNVAERIFHAGLSPQFIYCVRDPMLRTFSELNFYLRFNMAIYDSKGFIQEHILRNSLYYFQINHYLQCFSKERLHLIPFDALTQKQSETLSSLCTTLGIDNSFSFKNLAVEQKNRTDTALKRKGIAAYKATEKDIDTIRSYVKEDQELLFDAFGIRFQDKGTHAYLHYADPESPNSKDYP